jgi:diguanylate cyclase (GGDEF)-like protein
MPVEAVAELARAHALRLKHRWFQLCREDPTLPTDDRPLVGDELVNAIINAFDSPKPLEWALDDSVEKVIEEFTLISGSTEVASARLACLREAFDQVIVCELPEPERLELVRLLGTIIERAIIAVARVELRRLRAAALTDPLTGMLNRRAFEQDLARARAHFDRLGEPFAVAMIDLVGLKAINDTHGHIAGDAALRLMAEAIRTGTRADDRGYRVGGDEFALILPNTVLADPTGLIDRLHRAGAPECTIGVASLPGDPRDRLVELADSRLYDAREAHARP